MKIYVFGAKGMLGRYISAWFKLERYEVIDVNRDKVDAASIEVVHQMIHLFSDTKFVEGDIVINCMGAIKPRVDELGDINAIQVNAIFPHQLEHEVLLKGGHLIHPTTDCVFTGKTGNYNENDVHDVSDVYGRTKSLGEPKKSTVIRTSIIGDEDGAERSLIEWVKSIKDQETKGFTNHFWNGITCLHFAKVCQLIIEKKTYWEGVHHVFSPKAVNKFQLVEMISDIYDLNITITPFETPARCDRTLGSLNSPIKVSTPLKEQIQEQRDFFN